MSNSLPVFQPIAPQGAEHLVEVAFKGIRRGYFLTADTALREGDYVIVEAERGEDLGRIRSVGGVARAKCSSTGASATFHILRRAEPEEVRQSMVVRSDEERVRRQTRELVERHGLKMKVSDAEWQWDRNKLTIYFTADRRVDFRELVRDLARSFRTRIELKQIGVRDEAAQLGGLGRCGRQLCCATWLREIRPISLQLAKDQNLSLNPSQISGTCGRLMCCLTYEHDAYLQARKRFPREGKVIQTARGEERVSGIDIWRETVMLLDESRQRRVVTLAELKQEIAALGSARRDRNAALAASAIAPAPAPPAQPARTEGTPRKDAEPSRDPAPSAAAPAEPASQREPQGQRQDQPNRQRPRPPRQRTPNSRVEGAEAAPRPIQNAAELQPAPDAPQPAERQPASAADEPAGESRARKRRSNRRRGGRTGRGKGE